VILFPPQALLQLPKDLDCLYYDSRFKPKDKKYSLFFSEDNLFTTDGIVYIKILTAKALSEAIGPSKVPVPLAFIKAIAKAELYLSQDTEETLTFGLEDPWEFKLVLPVEENLYQQVPSLVDSYRPDMEFTLPRLPFIASLNLMTKQVDRLRNLVVLIFSKTNINVVGLNGDIEDWNSTEERSVSQQVIVGDLDLKGLRDPVSIHLNIKYLSKILRANPKKETFTCSFYTNLPPLGQIPFICIDGKYYLIPYNEV
jgi:hypothetical protein